MNKEQIKSFELEMTERGIHHDYWCDYKEEWLAETEELKQEIIEESKKFYKPTFDNIINSMFSGDYIKNIKAYNDERIKNEKIH